jgi:hypothetical protein
LGHGVVEVFLLVFAMAICFLVLVGVVRTKVGIGLSESILNIQCGIIHTHIDIYIHQGNRLTRLPVAYHYH